MNPCIVRVTRTEDGRLIAHFTRYQAELAALQVVADRRMGRKTPDYILRAALAVKPDILKDREDQ